MKGYTHLTEEEYQRILLSYEKTRSTALTAEELSLPKRRVSGVLSRRGVHLTKAHGGTCYHHKTEIEQWAKDGLSLSEIARRIGTKHQLVKKFLIEHQIEYTPYRQTMENNTFWRGGRMIDERGYILVKTPNHPYKDRHGYVREHRLVMEQHLGRYLSPHEVVHHKDNNPSNNDLKNLEVFGSNGEHLAETLKGQVPQWSDTGKARISRTVSQGRKPKGSANHQASKRDDYE